MTDWSAFETAYGSGAVVPDLLARAAARPDEDGVWNDLWSHLCHQGTVYTASYAALPVLADLAEQAMPAPYLQAVGLAAMIVGSEDRSGEAEQVDVQALHAMTIRRLHAIAEQCLATAQDERDLVYAVQCVVALEGVPHWATQLDRLLDGEAEGVCPKCAEDFYVDLDGEAAPADPEDLDAGSSRAYRLLTQREDVAQAFLKLAGTATCPHCGSTVPLYP